MAVWPQAVCACAYAPFTCVNPFFCPENEWTAQVRVKGMLVVKDLTAYGCCPRPLIYARQSAWMAPLIRTEIYQQLWMDCLIFFVQTLIIQPKEWISLTLSPDVSLRALAVLYFDANKHWTPQITQFNLVGFVLYNIVLSDSITILMHFIKWTHHCSYRHFLKLWFSSQFQQCTNSVAGPSSFLYKSRITVPR